MDADPSLTIEWVPRDSLRPNPANPRLNADAVPHVAASIRRFGWRQPIVAKRDGELIARRTGHDPGPRVPPPPRSPTTRA